MKFLDVPSFVKICSDLSVKRGDESLECVLESYSCKQTGADKKILKKKNCNRAYELNKAACLAPPQTFNLKKDNQHETTTWKTVHYLKSTLNSSFPDYEFSSVDSQQFCREPILETVISSVNNSLYDYVEQRTDFQQYLWGIINAHISLADCEIYSYIPQCHSDPFYEDNILWSFNYLFFNPKLKRVLFFACRSKRSITYIAKTHEETNVNVASTLLINSPDI